MSLAVETFRMLPDLAERLRERLAILLDCPIASIQTTADLGDLGVDSMMVLEIVALVEQHIGYEIPESDLPQLRTIDQILRYVGEAVG